MFAGLMSRWMIPSNEPRRGVGDTDAQIEHRFDLNGLPLSRAEGLPFQQFHGDEGSPVGLIDFVYRDVRGFRDDAALASR
jgi:hypothetical protein